MVYLLSIVAYESRGTTIFAAALCIFPRIGHCIMHSTLWIGPSLDRFRAAINSIETQ
jgi:hypothetical protein